MTNESVPNRNEITIDSEEVIIEKTRALLREALNRDERLDKQTFLKKREQILSAVETLKQNYSNSENTKKFLEEFENILPILDNPEDYDIQEEESGFQIVANAYLNISNSVKIIKKVEGDLSDKIIFEQIQNLSEEELDNLDKTPNLMNLDSSTKSEYIKALRMLKRYQPVLEIIEKNI